MKGRDSRIDSGYIGFCDDAREIKLTLALFAACGLKVWKGKGTRSLWTTPENTMRAREIRRGFKVGLQIRGEVYDVLLGLRAACVINRKSMFNCSALPLPPAPDRKLL